MSEGEGLPRCAYCGWPVEPVDRAEVLAGGQPGRMVPVHRWHFRHGLAGPEGPTGD